MKIAKLGKENRFADITAVRARDSFNLPYFLDLQY